MAGSARSLDCRVSVFYPPGLASSNKVRAGEGEMTCSKGHTYRDMLNATQSDVAKWSRTASVTLIQLANCPIDGSQVMYEVSDFTMLPRGITEPQKPRKADSTAANGLKGADHE